jgi:hypothetical protein
MKIISQKQRESALDLTGELLKRDGWTQTRTVDEWLDDAEMRPAQYQCSLSALQVMNCLGFGAEVIQIQQMA